MGSLAINSRSLAARGIAALLFGIIALFLPGPVLLGLVIVFGAFAFVSGFSALIAALKKNAEGRGWLLLEAVAGIFIGLATLVWPGLTLLTLTYFIAAWAIMTGIFEIGGAIGLRKYIRNEWLYLLSGALSILLGLMLLARPFAGILTLTFVLGIYGIVFGIASLVASWKVRKLEKGIPPQEERRAA